MPRGSGEAKGTLSQYVTIVVTWPIQTGLVKTFPAIMLRHIHQVPGFCIVIFWRVSKLVARTILNDHLRPVDTARLPPRLPLHGLSVQVAGRPFENRHDRMQ